MKTDTKPALDCHDNSARSHFEPSLRHELVTLEEMASILDVTGQTMRNWLKAGLVPAYRIGDLWRFCPIEIWDYLIPPGPDEFPAGAGAASGVAEIRTQPLLAAALRVDAGTVCRHRHRLPLRRECRAFVFNLSQVLSRLKVEARSDAWANKCQKALVPTS